MKIQLFRLYEMVCRYLGYLPEDTRQECGVLTLRERFNTIVTEVATEVVEELPVEWLETVRSFADSPLQHNAEEGSGTILLPSGFVRLVSFRLEGWQRTLYAAGRPGDPLHRLQQQPVRALRGSDARPCCFLTNSTIGAMLTYFCSPGPDTVNSTSHTSRRIAEALYIPAPAVDRDGAIELPRLAISAVAKRCAERLQQ
ncbi:MAG: hypothetical protein K2H75_01130 [Muribaculaceae bacterium]|nr:hypothetical protein [Muribaculaceae bacterium]